MLVAHTAAYCRHEEIMDTPLVLSHRNLLSQLAPDMQLARVSLLILVSNSQCNSAHPPLFGQVHRSEDTVL